MIDVSSLMEIISQGEFRREGVQIGSASDQQHTRREKSIRHGNISTLHI